MLIKTLMFLITKTTNNKQDIFHDMESSIKKMFAEINMYVGFPKLNKAFFIPIFFKAIHSKDK